MPWTQRNVRREIRLGFKALPLVIPYRVQHAPFADGLDYYLGDVHWLDALTPPEEQHLGVLVDLVREQVHLSVPPRPPERSTNPEARDSHNRGTENHHRGEFDLAIAEYTRAIELDPTIAWAFNDRGAAHLMKEDFDAALTDLNEGIRLDPTHA